MRLITGLVMLLFAGLTVQPTLAAPKRYCQTAGTLGKGLAELKRSGRAAAIADWIAKVNRAYGAEFANWDRSAKDWGRDKQWCVACSRMEPAARQRACGGRGDRYACFARAKACKNLTASIDCRPRVNTLGDGKVNRSQAKASARDKWLAQVTGLHGAGHSVWSKARETKLYCYNCKSGKAKNREVCGRVTVGDRCLASARPCMVR